MNFKKHAVLIVGGGIALVLLAIALVMLFKYQTAYGKVAEELDTAMGRLDRLHRRDPFPSRENVVSSKKNLQQLQDFFDSLMADLRVDQVKPEKMEPAAAHQLLEASLNRLRTEAKARNVVVPGRLGFGFDQYERGALPAVEDIGKLAVQLRVTERICELLYAVQISELISVEPAIQEPVGEEEMFADEYDLGRRRRRGGPSPRGEATRKKEVEPEEGQGLYTKESFKLNFFTREKALWDVLDVLASAKTFVRVSEVRLFNEKQTVDSTAEMPATRRERRMDLFDDSGPMLGEVPPGMEMEDVEPEYPSHDERIVAGNERVRVEMTVDIFRFGVDEEEPETP